MQIRNGVLLRLLTESVDKLMEHLREEDLKQDLLVNVVYQVAQRKSSWRGKYLEHGYLATAMASVLEGYLHSRDNKTLEEVTEQARIFEANKTKEDIRSFGYTAGCYLREIMKETLSQKQT
tara:strand:+ start:2839 stop:3201 length:363 start_codon:yes stop_codon:yes gene_type:complete